MKVVLSSEDLTTGFWIWYWSLGVLSGGGELLESWNNELEVRNWVLA